MHPAALVDWVRILDGQLLISRELADTFQRKAKAALADISIRPELSSIQAGFPEVRSCQVDSQPYRVLFRDARDHVLILAVIHESRGQAAGPTALNGRSI